MTEPRKRVLVSAYACGPGRASEPSVGWNAVSEIARDHDVWVHTSLAHRAEIEAALAQESPSLRFVFLDWPNWLPFIKSTRVGFEFRYYYWQIAAYLKARALHRRVRFDLAHHVTVCRYWMPSFLCCSTSRSSGARSAEGNRRRSRSGLDWGSAAPVEVVREVARFIGEHDPVCRRLARRAALGVATTGETANRMTRLNVARLEAARRSR